MNQTIFSLKRAYLSTKKTIDDGLAQYSLSWAQLEVLLALHQTGSLEQRELQEQLGLANPTLTRTVDHLVKNGYVRREVIATDARVKRLMLTTSAKQLLENLEQDDNIRLVTRFFQGFSAAEIATFTHFLTRVMQNMEVDQLNDATDI